MAQSRLEKIGTIFTRVTGLLRSGAMKVEDKPLWYDVYDAFPPRLEPRFDRPASNISIRKIFYEEDQIRAKYHKMLKYPETCNLDDDRRGSNTQQFIGIYNNLKEQGGLHEDKILETAKEMLEERNHNRLTASQELSDHSLYSSKLLENTIATSTYNTSKEASTVIIKDLFKD